MRPDRRLKFLLAVLGVALAAAAYWRWPTTTDPGRASSNPKAKAGGKASASGAPDVHLEDLAAARVEPGGVERNLFRFKPKPAPPPRPPNPVVTAPVVPSGPPPPPPLPPIALKFIGVIESESSPRMVILSDGRGAPLYGKEGDTVLGQYRIVRIGAESVEMSYLDGRGRQTIRLSGL